MNQLPTISNYGRYSSKNYGAHCLMVNLGAITLYYSYSTVIAFRGNGELAIRKNEWSTTTGKHLNSINSNKKIKIEGAVFERKLGDLLKKHNLTA